MPVAYNRVTGFCIVDRRGPRITDLMCSCHVQSRRVERALQIHILRYYTKGRPTDVYANYRQTPRNAPSGRVFDDIVFETASEHDGVLSLVLRKDPEGLDDGIVDVVVHAREAQGEVSRA